MKKILSVLFFTIFFFSFFVAAEAKPKKQKQKPAKHKIEFTTRDKFILVGDLYFAQNPSDKPLVVCLHSYSMNAQAWKELAEKLRLKDYNVLAMDLRGHGRSIYNEKLKLKSRFYFSDETWQKLPNDVMDSIKYVKTNYPKVNTNDVVFIGADLGAGVAANAAIISKKAPQKLILISPMLEFKGLTMPITSVKLYEVETFKALAKTDKNTFNLQTKKPAIVKRYSIGGPGNQLIKSNPDALKDIINFISNQG